MSEFQSIKYAVSDGLATLTLDRAPLNVLDIPMIGELNAALDQCRAEKSVRLLLLTGAGKAFSAGVEVADHTPDKVDAMIEGFHGIFRRLKTLPMPTVAAVNGAALGGGMELAIGCDMIVAAAGVKFGQPEIKLAVFPPVAAVLLPRMVTPTRAKEILLGGENFSAEEALAMGLVNRVYPRESFAADVAGFLAPFLALSGVALASTLRAVRAASAQPFLPALDAAEQIYLDELMATADAREGLTAFLEKRPAAWRHA